MGARRAVLLLAGLLGAVAPAAGAAPPPASPQPSPEVQLCLQHLRPTERARAEKILGPLDALPLYRAELDVQPALREVTGRLQLQYQARTRTLTELLLRVTPNAVRPDQVRLSKAQLNGRPVTLEHPEPALYRVTLDPPVPVGAAAILDVVIDARVPQAPPGGRGMLMAMRGAPSETDHGAFLATPTLISLIGVLPQVPAMDEKGQPIAGPSGLGDLGLYEPAHYLVSVTVPEGHAVHATGVALGEVPEKNEKVRFTFGAAAVRDFPLLVSRGYTSATTQVGDVMVESHFLPEHEAAGKKVLAHAAAAMTEFQRRLGPLPYTHFRAVEAPLTGGAGGMEFPGLITVASTLYDGAAGPLKALGVDPAMLQQMLQAQGMAGRSALPNLAPVFDQLAEFTVAHEVAHQYFAGLVGSDPTGAPVVDESLAQYAALLFIEWKHGKAAAVELRRSQLLSAYQLFRMMGGEDGAADRPTREFADATEYAALVYGKAPLLHAEERKLLGDEAFLRGMKGYVDAYRFKWAGRDSFTETLAKQSPGQARALRALRKHWWEEAHGDQDLGVGDMSSLLQQVSGQQLDPQTIQLLKQLLPALTGP